MQKSSRPHILITNDDGIRAKGIKQLWNALKSHMDLTVIAPAGEKSGVGVSITLYEPLRIETIHWPSAENIWSVSGTPADCVKIGLSAIMSIRPDLIVSGINRGSNLGRNILYSGTVGAAIESVIQGIPAIAFSSLDYHLEADYEMQASYIPYIVQHIMQHPLPEGSLLNVNFPEKALGPIRGFKMTNQGTNFWAENPDKRTHPAEGHFYYWLGSQLRQGNYIEDSDDQWIKKGYITAVPVHIGNLTDHSHLEKARIGFERLFETI